MTKPAEDSATPVVPSRVALGARAISRPASLRQIVFDRLVESIISGELAPGQHLVEGELAAQLGVSRQPVREALLELQAGGWIDQRRNQGAFVHSPTPEQADDLLAVRSMLEVESARLAAENRSHSDIAALWSIWHQGLRAVDENDVDAMVSQNATFHATIMRASRNTVLQELGQLVDRRVRWHFTPIARTRGKDSWDEHAAIIHALNDQNAVLAAQIMKDHTNRTRLKRRSES